MNDEYAVSPPVWERFDDIVSHELVTGHFKRGTFLYSGLARCSFAVDVLDTCDQLGINVPFLGERSELVSRSEVRLRSWIGRRDVLVREDNIAALVACVLAEKRDAAALHVGEGQ